MMDDRNARDIFSEAIKWQKARSTGYRSFTLTSRGWGIQLKLEESNGPDSRVTTVSFNAEAYSVTAEQYAAMIADPVGYWRQDKP